MRLFYFLPARARFEIELSLERIELEKITMGFARRRTRAVVTDLAEVVAALALAARQFVNLVHALGQAGGRGGQVVTAPNVSRCRTGASGSSAIRVKLAVPDGGSVHESSGETSAPSQVNFLGMSPPFGKLYWKLRMPSGCSQCNATLATDFTDLHGSNLFVLLRYP